MKSRILLLLTLILLAIPASAQWRYGLRLGGEFTAPTPRQISHGITTKGGAGFAGGLTLEWQMPTSGLAIGTALTYQRRTIRLNDTEAATIGGDFLTLPIDIKYKFWLQSVKQLAGPYLFTGPDIALRLSSGQGSRLHAGWNVGAGLDIVNFIQISGGYRFGINRLHAPQANIRDNGGFVNIAFLFDF